MLEWPLLLMAGLLGSSHCLGMCGGFALALGQPTRSLGENLRRQLTYTAGRMFTYAVLGAVAGFGGWRLAQAAPRLVNAPAVLAIVAGVVLVYQGILATGWGRAWFAPPAAVQCVAATFFRHFLGGSGHRGAFLAGLVTGLLPCGLLYGMLALAAATHDLGWGAMTMAVFGAGTAPGMIATGCGGTLLSLAARKRIYAMAAGCLMLTGAISVVRGVSFLSFAEAAPVADRCPFCERANP